MAGSCNDTKAQAQRIDDLRRQLVDLQHRPERLRRLIATTCQRAHQQCEVWPPYVSTEQNGPMSLPPIEVLESPRGEPVPVVQGEVLIPADADRSSAAKEWLSKRGFGHVESDCAGMLRLRLGPRARKRSLALVLRELADEALPGGPHHVAALRGDMKSVDGPEYTDEPPTWDHDDPAVDERALVIAIDTGIDPLVGNRTDRWLHHMGDSHVDPLDTFDEATGRVGPDGYLDGGAGHGTFVAGVVRQFAPSARVIVRRALDSRGFGSECDIAREVRAANQIFRNRTDGYGVLNLSLGLWTVDGNPPVVLERALRELPENVIVVAAAGNVPLAEPIWPASFDLSDQFGFDNVVGVAALQQDYEPAEWANTGGHVDFSAVGEGVSSTYVVGDESTLRDRQPECFPRDGQDHSYALWSGSSFAAPKVAAMLAVRLASLGSAQAAISDLATDRRDRSSEGLGYIIEA